MPTNGLGSLIDVSGCMTKAEGFRKKVSPIMQADTWGKRWNMPWGATTAGSVVMQRLYRYGDGKSIFSCRDTSDN